MYYFQIETSSTVVAAFNPLPDVVCPDDYIQFSGALNSGYLLCFLYIFHEFFANVKPIILLGIFHKLTELSQKNW